MKSFKYAVAMVLCLSTFLSFAQVTHTVWIADNNPNAPDGDHIFSSLQDAIDAAQPGDSVYVQPSPTKYGSATIDKEIHLFGIGFNLDKDAPLTSTITHVFLTNKPDNATNSSKSTVRGLKFDNLYIIRNNIGAPDYISEDVTISNCQFIQMSTGSYYYARIDSLTLYDNYITSGLAFDRTVTKLQLRNNLINGQIYFTATGYHSGIISNNIIYAYLRKNSSGDDLIIQNNNFIGASGTTAFNVTMLDAIIANNIFYGRTPSIVAAGGSSSTSFQRNVFNNNLAYGTENDELPPSGGDSNNSGDENLEGDSPLFADVDILSTWSSSYDFTLDTSTPSPAIDAGSDNSDIGITGGPYPWTESNFSLNTTAFPTIQTFNVNTIINPGDDLDVRIKVKAN